MPAARQRIGVFHPGTQHSWTTARVLQDADDLAWFATSMFWVKDRFPYTMIPWLPERLRRSVTSELRRFYHPGIEPRLIHQYGTELPMRIAARLGMRRIAHRLLAGSNVAFAHPVKRLMQRTGVRAVLGCDTSSLEVFRAARELGVTTILDRTIGHPIVYNNIMRDVFARYGEFFLSPDFEIGRAHIDRIEEEHALADLILVGSPYAASTLADPAVPPTCAGKVTPVPVCNDDAFFGGGKPRVRRPGEPLRFLFTGLACPRKGFHLLLKVFEKIPKSAATVTVIGDLQVPDSVFARYADRIEYHRTVPRPEVARFMREADVLLFPTYFEGGGIVLYEAMAMGMAIIQSRNAMVVLPEESPLLMDRVDEEALAGCVAAVLDDPGLLEAESRRNLAGAGTFDYAAYKRRFFAAIANV